MVSLEAGNYLGRIENLLNGNSIIISMTSYPDTTYSESLHYHDTFHASMVLKGGNIEKRQNRDIERLPGVVTFYDAGEVHRSTKTISSSTHINIEVKNSFFKQHDISINATKLHNLKGPDAGLTMLKIFNEINTGQHTSTVLNLSVNEYLNNRNGENTYAVKPKAYVNAILLDDQFKAVTNSGKDSWFEQAGNDQEFKEHLL